MADIFKDPFFADFFSRTQDQQVQQPTTLEQLGFAAQNPAQAFQNLFSDNPVDLTAQQETEAFLADPRASIPAGLEQQNMDLSDDFAINTFSPTPFGVGPDSLEPNEAFGLTYGTNQGPVTVNAEPTAAERSAQAPEEPGFFSNIGDKLEGFFSYPGRGSNSLVGTALGFNNAPAGARVAAAAPLLGSMVIPGSLPFMLGANAMNAMARETPLGESHPGDLGYALGGITTEAPGWWAITSPNMAGGLQYTNDPRTAYRAATSTQNLGVMNDAAAAMSQDQYNDMYAEDVGGTFDGSSGQGAWDSDGWDSGDDGWW